ncbi:hypothetical protein [Agromyces larvae]|uniref:Uncharacterized protein n=1 Tax=Agromyces larvae TaxID=2929802 RepID=A0ABY4C2F6_9MICO|nr:hypothetical protein [Agromyces larvae]UOE44158.1 hypothetical protein MTO99_18700 [Agromyces larvae]
MFGFGKSSGNSDAAIIRAINTGSVSSEDLVSREAWQHICRVRGRNSNRVNEKAWVDLCARRGYLLQRRNPRGF